MSGEPPVRVRPAEVSDLEAVWEVEREVFGSDLYPRFFFRQALDLWGGLLCVAAAPSGALAGYALAAPSARPGEAWILSAGVRAEHRGRGVAIRLTEGVLDALAASGARKVLLTVHPDNRGARALYEKLGFRVAGEEAGYFGPGEPRVVMRRELAG